MADESFIAVYPASSKISYTLPSYLDYLQQLRSKATELNKAGKTYLETKMLLNKYDRQEK